MKDFDQLPDAEKPQVEIPVIKKELRVATKLLHRGMKIWEIDMTKTPIEPVPVTYEVTTIEKAGLRHKVIYRKNCYYTEAINKKNALRHYHRAIGRSSSGLKAATTT